MRKGDGPTGDCGSGRLYSNYFSGMQGKPLHWAMRPQPRRRTFADESPLAMKAPSIHVMRLWATWIPVAGIAGFIALYLYAASMYPGGTQSNHGTHGYSHLSNYWCDLLDGTAYSGDVNRGRPFAVLATIILPLSLVPLWLQVPVLLRDRAKSGRFVQVVGSTAMVVSTAIFSSLHDIVINVAAVLGFTAFAVTVLQLADTWHRALTAVARLSAILCMANYLMWLTGTFLWAMPLVQKAAFVAFFSWIVAMSCAIRQVLVLEDSN